MDLDGSKKDDIKPIISKSKGKQELQMNNVL